MGKQAKWAAAIGAVVILVLGVFFMGRPPRPDAPPPPPPVAEAPPPAPAPAQEPAQNSPQAPEPAAPQPAEPAAEPPPKPAAPAADPAQPSQQAAQPIAPTLDVVRIDPAGSATVAGRAEAGARVTLRLDSQDIASASADGAGDYASLFTIPPSDTPRVLTAVARGADGAEVPGKDRFIVAPFAAPQLAASATTAETTATAPAEPATTAAAEPAPAPQVLKQTDQTVALVTAPPLDNVTIDTVTYGLDAIQIGGRGAAGAALRLYLDDTQAASTAIAADGTYNATVSGLAPGTYVLRADQLDAAGQVTSRYEMQIVKSAPEALAQLAPAPVVIEVDKGTTLWAIAKEHFGDGMMYVQVYAANRDKIRDPDLIYPGQVFDVPVLQMVKQPKE